MLEKETIMLPLLHQADKKETVQIMDIQTDTVFKHCVVSLRELIENSPAPISKTMEASFPEGIFENELKEHENLLKNLRKINRKKDWFDALIYFGLGLPIGMSVVYLNRVFFDYLHTNNPFAVGVFATIFMGACLLPTLIVSVSHSFRKPCQLLKKLRKHHESIEKHISHYAENHDIEELFNDYEKNLYEFAQTWNLKLPVANIGQIKREFLQSANYHEKEKTSFRDFSVFLI